MRFGLNEDILTRGIDFCDASPGNLSMGHILWWKEIILALSLFILTNLKTHMHIDEEIKCQNQYEIVQMCYLLVFQ